MYALTVADVRTIANIKAKDHEGDAILCRTVGMSESELLALPFPDYRKIVRRFWELVRDPLQDEGEQKNSQSESILESNSANQ